MQRWIFPLNLTLGALLVAVLALIAADLLGYRLKRIFPALPARTAATVPHSAQQNDLMAFAAILDKGLFGPATRGTLSPIVAQQAAATPVAPAVAPSDFVLLGTAVGSFSETFALVQKVSSREERVFRLGDQVFGAGPLISVKKEQAEILVNGQRVKLLTPLLAATNPPAAAAMPTPVAMPGATGGMAVSHGGGNYVVDQRALNAALDNIGQAMTDARLLPSVKDGKVEGFRASEVKPQGIFGTVGIRNGDVLMRINDFPIDSPEKAIQAFVTLKGQNRIKLDLVRDGQPSTFNYDIR